MICRRWSAALLSLSDQIHRQVVNIPIVPDALSGYTCATSENKTEGEPRMYNQYTPYNQDNQMPLRRRGPGSRVLGCGCLALVLLGLVGIGAGAALTTGQTQMIFLYIGGGMLALFLLLILLSMLLTRRGREVLAEGCAEGCLEAIFSGLTGG